MKPHIQKKGGVWWCGISSGRTPKEAYESYLFFVARYNAAFATYDRMWQEGV